jgi:hypothetical protein
VDRNGYLNRLRQIGESMEADPAQRAYALAPAAMITYVEGFRRRSASKAELDLAAAVVAMIDHGRQVQPCRSETRVMPSADPEGSNRRLPASGGSSPAVLYRSWTAIAG